jgi:hypothetical protein
MSGDQGGHGMDPVRPITSNIAPHDHIKHKVEETKGGTGQNGTSIYLAKTNRNLCNYM